MAFENDSNTGRVSDMVWPFVLIRKLVMFSRAEADALPTMMRTLIDVLTVAKLGVFLEKRGTPKAVFFAG